VPVKKKIVLLKIRQEETKLFIAVSESWSMLSYLFVKQVKCFELPKITVSRPFNYMFFTPLYGVRNTGCPQISPKNFPKLATKKSPPFFRGN
jgi:hypothetical protein